MLGYSFTVALRIWHPNIDPEVISRNLGMSAKTVEAHRASIKRKLKLKTGPELTRHAVLWVEAVR